MPDNAQIAARLAEIRARIDKAARRAGRDGAAVTLIAVSKTHPAETVAAALDAGHRHFGENRVQEAQVKWPALKEKYPDVVLHLIGGLQTNKVRDALALFDVIHTVDRPRLADAVARVGGEMGRRPSCFVQVNTGEEAQKGGCLPAEVDGLVGHCRGLGLDLAGLMCIPPVDEPPSPHFALLRKFGRRNGLDGLSMGMSGDYETAVELGATHVRVGSAIFGARG
ncbi:MAG: YggS family pyridoxal phosphate-dependent enzyme [Alphaproteobacteria bacterium]|nr:YggS family pyridoxal phosphate-dependent enzyme [Alphaproteobacteria bacterium]